MVSLKQHRLCCLPMSTSIMLFRTMFNQLVPPQLQHYISTIRLYWQPTTSKLSLLIEEKDGMSINHVYGAAETYLCFKITPKAQRLKITKSPKEKHFHLKFAQSEHTVDHFQGIELKWRYVREEAEKGVRVYGEESGQYSMDKEKRYFELTFEKKHKEKVLSSYLPFVIKTSEAIKEERKVLKIYNLDKYSYSSGSICWESVNLDHPCTFEKLAMDSKLKKAIMADLDLFVERKEFYRKVGKAWKRGYLLYGPPGTGKSSLIAAMANYLKFDIYDLQLGNVRGDSTLRKLMLRTANRSILVMEDIDCSGELPDRNAQAAKAKDNSPFDPPFSLSGLLNFIDGLWSSLGDERIIIFTTNKKERLDPALLRPGRMDMHIHMSYLTSDGFKVLASNYLDIHGHHRRFGEIDELIDSLEVTPAEVAEELMKSPDAEVSLGGLINFLKLKKVESDEAKEEGIIKDAEEVQEKAKI